MHSARFAISFVSVVCYFVLEIRAWSFTASPSGECAPMTGGTPPFKLGLHPVSGGDNGEVTMTVDSNAFQTDKDRCIPLPFAQGMKFIVTMGDATGLLTGGASEIFTAGARPAGTSPCSLAPGGNDFYFSSPGRNPKQCESYAFTDISIAPSGKLKMPATLLVIMPGGLGSYTVQLNDASSSPWTVNVVSGTTVLLGMIDSEGNNGGHDDLRTIDSGSSSCDVKSLQQVSPITLSSSATSAGPTGSTSPGTGTTTSGTGNTTPNPGLSTVSPISVPSSHTFSTGAIAGTTVGGLVVLGLLAFLVFLLLRRKKDGKRKRDSENASFTHHLRSTASGSMSYQDPNHLRSSVLTTTATPPHASARSPNDSFVSSSSPVRTSPYTQNIDNGGVQRSDLPQVYSHPGGEKWTGDSNGTNGLLYWPAVSAALGPPLLGGASGSVSGPAMDSKQEHGQEHWMIDEKGNAELSYRPAGAAPPSPPFASGSEEKWIGDEKGPSDLSYRPAGAAAPNLSFPSGSDKEKLQ
ncbi:hypothetical protein DL96DRAFT_1646063 [Flagelloscypha sp. PMI_526]|nr:hypothetical protein DL96DRAFT_1646063 [Flagelloscypha sp. PMI_526]